MKTDAYQVVTDRIVGLLDQGIIPWQQPWKAREMSPRNLVSQHEYRGVNIFLLNASCYQSPYWLTFKQARELGGSIKRGEKACPVVFWKWLESKEETDAKGKPKKIPFLRYYSVFNVAQCQNIPKDRIPPHKRNERQHNPIEAADSIVAGMPKRPQIRQGGNRACYCPSPDRVDIPQPETFRTGQDYYSVLFHELTHSTCHESRLNRKGVSGSDGEWSAFGSTPYAKEELVAEMGAAFLCGQAGIVERTIENSTAYVQSWLQRLKDDRRLVVQAAAQAQRAADYILGRKSGQESGVDR